MINILKCAYCGKEMNSLKYTMEEWAETLEWCTKRDDDVETLIDEIAKLADEIRSFIRS